MSQLGVGPVITAGLLAHLDIERAPSAGHFWSFAGLNPNMKWEKGQKRPYNAELKQITYHLGECFKRTSKHPEGYYGNIYAKRKELLVRRNELGFNAERAKTYRNKLAGCRRKVSKEGKLPAGNLDRQACNYAAKMFLAHLHAVMQFDRYGRVTIPYAIAQLDHAHPTEIRFAEGVFPGFEKEYAKIFRFASLAAE